MLAAARSGVSRIGVLTPCRDPLRLTTACAAVRSALGDQAEIDLLAVGAEPERLDGLYALLVPDPRPALPALAMEAMGAGVPVAAAGAPTRTPLIHHGESGFLVDGTPGMWEEFLTLPAAERSRLGEAGRKTALARCGGSLWLAKGSRDDHSAPASSGWRKVVKRGLEAGLPPGLARWRGRAGKNAIAVTFDDGPHPRYTPQVLDILREHGVRATFFLVGSRAEQYPAVVERIAAEGHEIANHTYSHPHLARLDLAAAGWEIAAADRALRLAGAPVTRLLRPPFGDLSARTLLACWRSRYTAVYWSADLKDYRAATPDEILDGLRGRPLRPGDILLYHGVTAPAVAALPRVLDAARDAGRRACVTVTEMAA